MLSNCDTAEVEGEEGPAWVEGGEVVGEVMLQHRSLVLRLTVRRAETQQIDVNTDHDNLYIYCKYIVEYEYSSCELL